jgi:hypothetical protein
MRRIALVPSRGAHSGPLSRCHSIRLAPDQGGSDKPAELPTYRSRRLQGLTPPTCVELFYPRCQERKNSMSFHGFLVSLKVRCLPLTGDEKLPSHHDAVKLQLPEPSTAANNPAPTCLAVWARLSGSGVDFFRSLTFRVLTSKILRPCFRRSTACRRLRFASA